MPTPLPIAFPHVAPGTLLQIGTDGCAYAVARENGDAPSADDTIRAVADLFGAGVPGWVADAGVVLRSPNGTRYRVTVDDAGTLGTTAL